jgi:L-alanine-DL-glutamate epimerase-like enolase superfamily enzyme
MRIVAIEATPVAVPFKEGVGTVVTSRLVLHDSRHVIVRLHTDEGIHGTGEALPRPSSYGETIESILAILEQVLAPLVLGADPFEIEALWQRLDGVGENTTSKCAIETACHDIIGKACGQPIHRLLGGYRGDRIPLTMPIAMGSEEDVVRQAKDAVAEGYRSVKVKVGKDLRRDAGVVEAVRSAIGDDVALYVDANQGYSSSDALKAGRIFETLGVDLFEEPVAASDDRTRLRLSQTTAVPLLLDESIETPADAQRAIALGTAGAFSVRSPRLGFAGNRKLVAVAEAGGVPCVAGSHREAGVGTAATAHLAAAFAAMSLPAELGVHALLSDGLLTEPLEIAGGHLTVPAGPGLGIEVDDEKLDRYRLGATREWKEG